MRRPHVSVKTDEAALAVFDFFEKQEPNPLLMRNFHIVASRIYLPHTVFDKDTEEATQEHLDQGNKLFLAAYHLKADDAGVLAALLKQNEMLRPLISNIVMAWSSRRSDTPRYLSAT